MRCLDKMLVRRQLPDDDMIATNAGQFYAVSFCHHGNRARSHDRRFDLAVPIVPKAKAMSHFVKYHGQLVVRWQRREVRRVNRNETRAIRERCRPSHALGVDILSRLVELNIDRRWGKPEAPQNDSGRNKVFKHGFHATPASQARGLGVV